MKAAERTRRFGIGEVDLRDVKVDAVLCEFLLTERTGEGATLVTTRFEFDDISALDRCAGSSWAMR